MGLKDLIGKVTGKKKEKAEAKPEAAPEPKEEVSAKNYGECSYCQKPGADRKWMGQVFHKKCMRQLKKMSKKMI